MKNSATNLDQTEFETLLAQFTPVQPRSGSLLEGTVVKIDSTHGAWVHFGGKCEGLVPARELDGTDLITGAQAAFLVIGADDEGGITLSLKRAIGWTRMQQAHSDNEIVTATVIKIARNNSGGISGINVRSNNLQGFVPYSLVSNRGPAIEALTGTEISLIVVDVNVAEHKLIFNQKAAQKKLNERNEMGREARFNSLLTGEVITGTVVNVAEYGAFIDIGDGQHGLVHRTEMSASPDAAPLSPGSCVTAKVVEKKRRSADGKRQIALSIKQVEQSAYLENLNQGDLVEGVVSRVVTFGAFVIIAPEHGVYGLVHKSQFNTSLRKGRRTLTSGETVRAQVVSVDKASGRIELSLRNAEQE